MKAPISLCLIVKNEPLLENLILSIKDYVSEIVIVDTGSTDGTDIIAKKYADKYERYTACNDSETGLIEDFSQARDRSYALATQPWVMWADADDEIVGGENLLKITNEFGADKIVSIMFPYEYSYNEDGTSTCTHYRERLVNNKNCFHWLNPVHEVLVHNNGTSPIFIIKDEVMYKHRRQYGNKVAESGRNLRILRKYFEKHGDSDARQLYYLGLECYNSGLVDEAIERLTKYIDVSGWDDERCMACLKLVDIYIGKGEYEKGLTWAFKIIALKETWGEGYFSLGKLYYFMAQRNDQNSQRHWERAAHFIKVGLDLPPTKTLLFINPTERQSEIHKFYNMALSKLGKIDEALASINDALKYQPNDPTLLNNKAIYEAFVIKNKINEHFNFLLEKKHISKDKYDKIISLLSESKLEDHSIVKKEISNDWNIPSVYDYDALPLEISDEQISSITLELWKQYMLRDNIEAASSLLKNDITNSLHVKSATKLTEEYLSSDYYKQIKDGKITESVKKKLDIVFFAGNGVEVWTPNTVKKTGIGGSELMLMEQAKRLSSLGHRVRVYNSCGDGEGFYDGVQYLLTDKYVNLTCDVLIVSRRADMLGDQYNIKAKLKLLWVHDIFAISATNELLLKADRILALTNWHKNNIIAAHNVSSDHVLVTRNGIDLNRFNKQITKNPHKVVNSSSPDRSWPILLDVWPQIKSQVPDAELHLYYGFKNWEVAARNDQGQMDLINFLKNKINEMAPLGVVFHDRINQEQLAEEFLSAGVWAHPTWFTETSCISAMEMQAAGVRTTTSSIAALNETVANRGVLINGDWTTQAYKDQFIASVVSQLKDNSNEDRVALQKYAKENFGLDDLAKDWEKMFFDLIEEMKVNPIVSYQPTIPYRGTERGQFEGDTRLG